MTYNKDDHIEDIGREAAARLQSAHILLRKITGADVAERRELLEDGWLLHIVEETVQDVERVLRGALNRLARERQTAELQ